MSPRSRVPAWLTDAQRIDEAVYAAIAVTPTPALDDAMRRLSSAADGARIWLASAAALAATRGRRGRRAAAYGLASVATTSTIVNVLVKPVARRRRPDRDVHGVPLLRQVPMPSTRSLPSGHAASAFAFATGVGHVLPRDAVPLRFLAMAVGYSRVHTGVHFPGDVLIGALIGTATAQTTTHALDQR